jgi:HD domain
LHQEVDAKLVVPAALRILIVSVSAAAIVVTIAAFYFFPIRPELGGLPGLAFWTVVTLLASALPVRFPRGNLVSVNTAPILASMVLGGPAAAGLITWIGTSEWRELRGRIPWYGTLYNHAAIAGPAIVAALLYEAITVSVGTSPLVELVATSAAGLLFFGLNSVAVSTLIATRQGGSVQTSIRTNLGEISTKLVALAPLSWLMAFVYLRVGWWASLLFALPLYTTREAYHRFVEMREMFTSTVRALASAVDARDTWTSGHSTRVQEIAVVIAKEMRVSAALLEAIEWGGLLHDVGKIGVRDAILLKEDRLTREERIEMNAHPIIGARILHVADAFEAMTSPRPYRPKPLTPDAALREIRKFTGVQFDPKVVEAFVRTPYASGLADPGRPPQPTQLPTSLPILAAAAATAQTGASGGALGGDNAGVDAS